MSALDQLLVRFVKEEIHPSFQELYVNNFPEKRVVSGNGKRQKLVTTNAPVPIGHLAKIKH